METGRRCGTEEHLSETGLCGMPSLGFRAQGGYGQVRKPPMERSCSQFSHNNNNIGINNQEVFMIYMTFKNLLEDTKMRQLSSSINL